MSRFKLGKTILVVTAIIVWLGGSVFGRTIECEIIQFKLDRFYFSAGTEQDIFEGSLFAIVCNDSTVYQGRIEIASLGVCFSEPTGQALDTSLLASCTALLELPDVDSVSGIRLHCLAMDPSLVRHKTGGTIGSGDTPAKSDDLTSARGNPISINRIEEIELLLETDPPDGLFSFISPENLPLNLQTRRILQSSPAPFFAAMIPNLSKSMNGGGLLTTSLYYRFSDNNLERLFTGDNIEPYHCNFPSDSGCPRPYPFHPQTGRAILSNYEQRPLSIRIGVADASLVKAAEYFADVLSRDHIRVKYVADPHDADLWMRFIPISNSNPESSLQKMMEIAMGSGTPVRQVLQSIDLVTQRIASARGSANSDAAYYFCELADRTMKEDLGIFPLFRPRLYLATDQMLKGASFDSMGYFVHDGLILLTPPEHQRELQK